MRDLKLYCVKYRDLYVTFQEQSRLYFLILEHFYCAAMKPNKPSQLALESMASDCGVKISDLQVVEWNIKEIEVPTNRERHNKQRKT